MMRASGIVASLWARSALVTLLVAGTGACPPDDEVDEKPPITAIEIVPWRVVTGSSAMTTRFELEVRLWTGAVTDRRSITETQGYTPAWNTTGTWLTKTGEAGFRANFEVAPNPTPGSAKVTVVAGGKTAEAEVIVHSAPLAGQDAVAATYDPDRIPDAVVVNGERPAATLPCVSLSAFVRRSMLDALVNRCPGDDPGWEAAILAEDHQMVLTRMVWTSASDPPVNVPSQQTSLRSLPVVVRLMVGTDPLTAADPIALRAEVEAMVGADVELANDLLAENRAGIALRVDETKPVTPPNVVNVTDCLAGDLITAGEDDLLGQRLHLYYVNKVGSKRGRSCGRHDQRKHEVIYIAYEGHSTASLVHEVGHALGLTLPEEGHPDLVGGFDRTNIMASGLDDYEAGERRRLSVGQVFRMNAEPASWLNWAMDIPANPNTPVRETTAPRVPCRCGSADQTGPCPPLAEDVARPSGRVDRVADWQCYDLLQILVPVAESPVGVLAGRSWRDPPGGCRPDLPGSNHEHGGGAYIQFENLTRPGTCDSWAALFFRERGVVFLPLDEPGHQFTQAADLLLMSHPNPVPGRIKITVHTYFESADNTKVEKVEQDVEHVTQTFGPSNRSGVELGFDHHGGVTCPQTDPAALEVHLCYTSDVAGEGQVTPPRRIAVHVPNWTPTTASHFLGRALELPVLATAAGLPNNVMHAASTSRGQVLTLSQVFRISSTLNPSLCGTRTCPTLSDAVSP